MADEVVRAKNALWGAVAGGDISEETSAALRQVPDVAWAIGRAMAPDRYFDTEVLLVTVLVDDSWSIGSYPARAEALRNGHNRMIEEAARQRSDRTEVLFHTRFFTKAALGPYAAIDRAIALSVENYSPDIGQTPLYQQSLITLGSVIAQARLLTERGCRVRTYTLLITDGENNAGLTSAADVRLMVVDMLDFASNHIIAGMGIGEHYEWVFREMGIRRIYSAADPKALDDAFQEIRTDVGIAASSELAFKELTAGSSQ